MLFETRKPTSNALSHEHMQTNSVAYTLPQETPFNATQCTLETKQHMLVSYLTFRTFPFSEHCPFLALVLRPCIRFLRPH